jgi:hypothetical protein
MSDKQQSEFDRLIGQLDGLPEVVQTKASVIRAVPMLGIGSTQLYVIQTYRQRDKGDMIFMEHVSEAGTVRLVIPPAVADCIARQRDQLTTKSRSRAAKAVALERMERGEAPAFTRKKGGAK